MKRRQKMTDADRRIRGDFHIRSIGGDVPPCPGFGTPEGAALQDRILKAALDRIRKGVSEDGGRESDG